MTARQLHGRLAKPLESDKEERLSKKKKDKPLET
jgi:hypothetical protein